MHEIVMHDIYLDYFSDTCTGLPSYIANLITTAEFPVDYGSELTVLCEENYSLTGDNTLTCQKDTEFIFTQQPECVLG